MINVPDEQLDIGYPGRTEVAKSHISRGACDEHSRRHRSDAQIAGDHDHKAVLTAIFDRPVDEIPLTQGHEHEQRRAERFGRANRALPKSDQDQPRTRRVASTQTESWRESWGARWRSRSARN